MHYYQNHDKANDPHRREYGVRHRGAKGTAGSSQDVDASQHSTCPLLNSPDDRQNGILYIGQTRRGALVWRLFYLHIAMRRRKAWCHRPPRLVSRRLGRSLWQVSLALSRWLTRLPYRITDSACQQDVTKCNDTAGGCNKAAARPRRQRPGRHCDARGQRKTGVLVL